jgi:hypothetical protein
MLRTSSAARRGRNRAHTTLENASRSTDIVINGWIDVYTRLTRALEGQLRLAREYTESVPEAMRPYLDRQEASALTEELDGLRRRLGHWRRVANTTARRRAS